MGRAASNYRQAVGQHRQTERWPWSLAAFLRFRAGASAFHMERPDVRAIVAETLESLESYAAREVPAPDLGAGQVRIRVAACGVGYVDALVALGRYQVKPPLPHTPGQEIAGLRIEVVRCAQATTCLTALMILSTPGSDRASRLAA